MKRKLVPKRNTWPLLAGLCLITVIVYIYSAHNHEYRHDQKIKRESEKVISSIKTRTKLYESVLSSGVALFNASEHVNRQEWKIFVASFNLKNKWPGIQGVGFSKYISPKNLKKHVQEVRNEGFSKYQIKPEGKRKEYSSIVYLEPFDWRNRRAFGYDMWSNEVRRKAMTRARDTGLASSSGIITLVQETKTDVQKGFLTYLPVYHKNKKDFESIDERKKYFMGWVYSAFRAKDLLNGIQADKVFNLEFSIYHDSQILKESLLYQSNKSGLLKSPLEIQKKIEIQGRVWTLVFKYQSAQSYFAQEPLLILVLGLIFSFLFSLIFNNANSLKRKAEILAAKKESEAQLILKGTGLGLWRYYPKKEELSWDESMFSLYEIDQNKFKTDFQSWSQTVHPADIDCVTKEVEDALNGIKEYDTQFRIKTPKGETKYIRAKGDVISNENGDVVQIMGINWDISQERKMQKDLDEQKSIAHHRLKLAAIGEMAAGVGHEINNPLAIISSYANLLAKKDSASFQMIDFHEAVLKISDASSRINHIVKGLRNFSRSDNSEIKEFEILETLRQSVELVKGIYKNDGIEIEIKKIPTQQSLYVQGNQGRIQQVFMNIISNARDAISLNEEKNINIYVEFKNDTVSVEFQDNGHGIPKENQTKIFNPFFTTKEINKGTGIGLSLVHNYVKEMNGTITLSSAQGKGATFVLELPASIQESKQDLSNTQVIKIAEIQKKPSLEGHILLVDDEKGIREVLTYLLEDMGLKVTSRENGEEGYQAFIKDPELYDVIISDMSMPVLNGIGFLKNIRGNTELEKQPSFLFMTGDVTVDFENSQSQIGSLIQGYLLKPFDEDKIYRILFSLLPKKLQKESA